WRLSHVSSRETAASNNRRIGASAHHDMSAFVEATHPATRNNARHSTIRHSQMSSIWVMLYGTTWPADCLEKSPRALPTPEAIGSRFSQRVAARAPKYETTTATVPVAATACLALWVHPVCQVSHPANHTAAGTPTPIRTRSTVPAASADATRRMR